MTNGSDQQRHAATVSCSWSSEATSLGPVHPRSDRPHARSRAAVDAPAGCPRAQSGRARAIRSFVDQATDRSRSRQRGERAHDRTFVRPPDRDDVWPVAPACSGVARTRTTRRRRLGGPGRFGGRLRQHECIHRDVQTGAGQDARELLRREGLTASRGARAVFCATTADRLRIPEKERGTRSLQELPK